MTLLKGEHEQFYSRFVFSTKKNCLALLRLKGGVFASAKIKYRHHTRFWIKTIVVIL
jgi:hypothetical protein